jgi:hypothetical protein
MRRMSISTSITKLRLATLVCAIAMIGAAGPASAIHSEDPPSKPPDHYSWGYRCPDGYPIIVDRGRYYPAGYPTIPSQKVAWTACFVSEAAAAHAGYKRMPTPRGYALLDGIYLAPAFNFLKGYCRDAARVSRLAVPCPALTPSPASSFVGCSALPKCYSRGVVLLEGSFLGPPGYVAGRWQSCPTPTTCTTRHNKGHLILFAATGRKIAQLECCGRRAALGKPHVRQTAGRWFTYPNNSSLNAGHVLLEWRATGFTYAVSVYHDSQTNRRLALKVANAVRFVK